MKEKVLLYCFICPVAFFALTMKPTGKPTMSRNCNARSGHINLMIFIDVTIATSNVGHEDGSVPLFEAK